MNYALAYDIGTTGVKTCLFEIDEDIRLIADANEGYELYVFPDGGAEQDPNEWWQAMCNTTRKVIKKGKIKPESIDGISFCSQMQGLVLVDEKGMPVRRAMSYMDQRAKKELKKYMAHGVQVAGGEISKVLKSLKITGAASVSVKDPVYKYLWVKDNEPENFRHVHKWLDVKEALIARMTGEFIMTEDSAFATLIYDNHEGKHCWSPEMCKMFGVDMKHLAKIIKSTDYVGGLTKQAAEELGLAENTAVYGGGGDASLIGVGAGAVKKLDTHIYMGTSGWVSTVVDKSLVDVAALMASTVGAQPGLYNYFAELETAGKCLEWVKDHLALDEIGVYLKKTHVAEDMESQYTNLYQYMSDVTQSVPAGSNGVIFTPWLHGNRCPFEDPNAKGMFFNISLETSKRELIRAVAEGVCFHMRWMLEIVEKKTPTSQIIRFVGGGALADSTSQILADCIGRTVETVASPQNVGAVGAAVVVAVGLGIIGSVDEAGKLIKADKIFKPNPANKAAYDKNFAVYKELYKSNKNNFKLLNG
ncbi:MAG: FGGY-family carbohydrate kinase [Ruminococcus sp.]|nr:FGGY-family carbohydrate kinase [Ruminococcus sp.]MCM1391159.1 FGGY-family carbohydrate kinase [Ruminococcus sp.]